MSVLGMPMEGTGPRRAPPAAGACSRWAARRGGQKARTGAGAARARGSRYLYTLGARHTMVHTPMDAQIAAAAAAACARACVRRAGADRAWRRSGRGVSLVRCRRRRNPSGAERNRKILLTIISRPAAAALPRAPPVRALEPVEAQHPLHHRRRHRVADAVASHDARRRSCSRRGEVAGESPLVQAVTRQPRPGAPAPAAVSWRLNARNQYGYWSLASPSTCARQRTITSRLCGPHALTRHGQSDPRPRHASAERTQPRGVSFHKA